MRRWSVLVLVSVALLGFADSASAKKPKPEPEASEATDAAGTADPWELALTNISTVDEVFAAAKAPIDSIRTAKMKIDGVNGGLNTALALPAGTSFKDAIADLKTKAEGKVTLAMEGDVPKLAAGEGVPQNVTDAINAVNTGIADAKTAIAALAAIPQQCQDVAAKAQALADPAALISAGANPLQAPKIVKAVVGNIKILGNAPGEVTALAQSFETLLTDLKGAFAG